MTRAIILALGLFFIGFPAVANAQEQAMLPGPSNPDLLASAHPYFVYFCNDAEDEFKQECSDTGVKVLRLIARTADLHSAELEAGAQYKDRQFDRHEIASWFAFFAAHIFVVVGTVAAIFEFWRAYRAQPGAAIQMDIQIQPSGVSIRSATNGMIILSVTLAFYFAYLTLVYPITT